MAAHTPWMGRTLLGIAQRLRGSRSLEILREIEAAPFRSRDEVLAAQFAQLRRLLEHAQAKVPYYRELFAGLGLRAEDIHGFDDFSRLPILTKEIIRREGKRLVRDDVPIESLSPHASGGSTGVPLEFYRDREYMDASDAGTFRNLRQCGWQPGEMVAFFWGGNEKLYRMPRWEFEARQRLRRWYQFDPFHSGPQDMDRWLERWPSLGATAAHGYASTIARFAAHAEARGVKLAPLRGVFTTAEKLYRPQRETITRVFGCQAFDCYGSSEVQNIAAECPRGRMHVNADYVIVEVTREAGASGPAPFLLTSLRNYSMPFLRYRNEDCGELVEGVCDCGSGFPLMKLEIARITDNFVLPGGRIVHGEYFTHLMYGSRGVESFQFHQTAPDAITLWIVPAAGDAEGRREAIRKAAGEVRALSPAIQVEVKETSAIPLSAAGKHRFTRSDVSMGAAG